MAIVQRERSVRVKHAALLNAEFVEQALAAAGVAWVDVDYVAVSTSQSWPLVLVDETEFNIEYDPEVSAVFGFEGRMAELQHAAIKKIEGRSERAKQFLARLNSSDFKASEYLAKPIDTSTFTARPGYEWSLAPDWWQKRTARDDLTGALRKSRASRPCFGYIPALVTLRGLSKPALTVPHHFAHAASAFYQSPKDTSAVYTVDNGDVWSPITGYVGGIYAYGEGHKLTPIGPSFGVQGHFYQRLSEMLDLGYSSGAGKLMGLAPYGNSVFFDFTLVGNAFEIFGTPYAFGRKDNNQHVLKNLLQIVASRINGSMCKIPKRYIDGYEAGAHGAENLVEFKVDLAASGQKIFEEAALKDITALAKALYTSDFSTESLCLSGGGGLNCPANSRIYRSGLFSSVFVPPFCDDSGLALGAAQAVYHDVLGRPRDWSPSSVADVAYLGPQQDDGSIDRALASVSEQVVVDDCDTAQDAASAIAAGGIVGWFEGRSEVGPRALGHRSLLADPRGDTTWRRVNDLKQREYWRPFAPAVLAERANDWFQGAPSVSPYMLFTAQVRGDKLPAITHVDGSARLQTVDRSTGRFREVIEAFDRLTGVPVVLNTSFNGPGEPIVETPEHALRFLLTSGLDALYFDGKKVTRRH